MKYLSFHVLVFIALALTAAAQGALAQAPQTISTAEWTRIESKGKDFSVAVPFNDCLVMKESERHRIWCSKTGIALTIEFQNTRTAIDRFNRFAAAVNDPKFQSFHSGDFYGGWVTTKNEKFGNESSRFYFASSKGWYAVSAQVKTNSDVLADVYQRFLRSIRIGGKQIVNKSMSDPPDARSIEITTLETSDEMVKALKRPARTDLTMERMPDSPSEENDPLIYSRPMIVLETQRIALTDEVRQKNLRGMLSVEIDLLASGIVGKIRIRGSAGHDMDYNAFDAARQIKFLPAEIDGKPVDSVLQIAYDFGIVKN